MSKECFNERIFDKNFVRKRYADSKASEMIMEALNYVKRRKSKIVGHYPDDYLWKQRFEKKIAPETLDESIHFHTDTVDVQPVD
jgi:hypothetical protein